MADWAQPGSREASEVLEYVDEFLGELWLDPETGEEMDYCPWLDKEQDKFICTIDKVRSEVCREYPVNIEQMKADCCEMLETGDIGRSEDELMKKFRN